MLKLASKFAMDILPSVIATVIGAYIVNHYVNSRPPSGATAAAVSSIDAKKAASKGDPKPTEKSADLGHVPEPGVRAKGIPEKSITDKAATEKVIPEKPADKADKPSETASIPPTTPVEPRRHQPASRERAAAKPVPVPAPAAPVTEPAAAPASAEPTPDANDLARAAIERLRASEPSRPTEAVRAQPEAPRVVAAPVVTAPPPVPAMTAPPVQPLPPPIQVSTPPADAKVAYPPARTDDPNRPTPPADIPDPRPPLDLRADAAAPDTPAKRPSLGDDVLSAAKSMFHSVLPK